MAANHAEFSPPAAPDPLRLFIALPLPTPILDQLVALCRRLEQGCRFTECRPRWASPDALHLTLAFLGDQPAQRGQSIGALLEELAGRYASQRLEIKQLGVFPHWKRPRVLWAGVRDRTHRLAALHGELNRALAPFGYQPEARPFHPHITLARFKNYADLGAVEQLTHDQGGFRFGPFLAEELALFRSELLADGARHTRLSAHRLSGAPAAVTEQDDESEIHNHA